MVTDDQAGKSKSRTERHTDLGLQFVSRSKTIQQRKQLRKRALKIVNNYTLLSGGIGLITIPIFYQIAVGGLLGKMLYDLSELYGSSLTKQKNKAIIASVLGGAHSEWITVYLGDNIEKILPGMVAISNTIARPVVAAGITYTIGRLFVKHFDSGAWLKAASATNVSLVPYP
jgi:uncharacterized protein (DUF697 family)